MNPASPSTPSLRHILNHFTAHWKLWLLPAAVISLAVGAYAIFSAETWEAAQAVMVRNEAANAQKTPGKFDYPEEMKTVQETFLELVKSRDVLAAALRAVGPAADCKHPETWPTERDIAEFRKDVKLAPPKGAEFGKTEVFYLDVEAVGRERAIALNKAIFQQLCLQSQKLRDAKAQSIIEELLKTVQVAKTDLDAATTALTATEKGLGSDLAELRSMQDMASSDSALRRSAEEIRAQIRENAAMQKTNEELLAVLEAAQADPGTLVAVSNHLLDSQPALRRLKDGLVDAQLQTATLAGKMSQEHPHVKAAMETEREIGRHLHNELALALRGVKIDLRLNGERETVLQAQLAKTLTRLDALAAVRATYTNQVAEVKHRTTLLERAEQNLAEARAAQASARVSHFISPIGAPDAGVYPVGPGRTVIALSGVFGGLLAGFGLVFLCVPVAPATGTPIQETPADANGCPVATHVETPQTTAAPEHAATAKPFDIKKYGGRLTLTQSLEKLAKDHWERRAR